MEGNNNNELENIQEEDNNNENIQKEAKNVNEQKTLGNDNNNNARKQMVIYRNLDLFVQEKRNSNKRDAQQKQVSKHKQKKLGRKKVHESVLLGGGGGGLCLKAKLFLHEYAKKSILFDGQGYKRCSSKSHCMPNKCSCKNSHKLCNSKMSQ
jgi:hypothetical protein